MRFANRTVLVAGGTGALGRVVTLQLLNEGAVVIVAGRRRSELEALQGAAGTARDRLSLVQADLSSPNGTPPLEEAIERAGQLDAVVNAVGAWAGGAPVHVEAPGALDQMLAANLMPLYALARLVMPVFARQRSGALVEVASLAAEGAQPGQASYAAAKAAAMSLVRSLAQEARPHGARVNAVLPGTMDTEANRRAMPDVDPRTWVSTTEVARVILFLCSDDARSVNGAAVPVNASG